jgi:hypothetical protein
MFRSVFISPGMPVQPPCRAALRRPRPAWLRANVPKAEDLKQVKSGFRNVVRAMAEECGEIRRWLTGTAVVFGLGRRPTMLWTIALILLVLWALGLVSSVTMGGFIHLLLVAAIVLVLVRLIQGRRVV